VRLDLARLQAWSAAVAADPVAHRARVEAALDRQPALRRWIERQTKGMRISVRAIALYYSGIVLSALEQAGPVRPVSGAAGGAAFEALADRLRGVEWAGVPAALLHDQPDNSPRREIVAAVLERETPAGFLPLREYEPVALTLLLCALLDAAGAQPACT
jgi:hypothetical protein